jgi:surface antigen
MLKKVIAGIISLILLTSCTGSGQNENAGAIFGGITGAVVGSTFGKGNGMIVGTALGTLAGAMIGSSIGRQMDERDRMIHYRTSQSALEGTPDGQVMAWQNPNNGHRGYVTPTHTFQKINNGRTTYCREYQQTVEINGQKQNAYGTACRQPEGSWQVVQ